MPPGRPTIETPFLYGDKWRSSEYWALEKARHYPPNKSGGTGRAFKENVETAG